MPNPNQPVSSSRILDLLAEGVSRYQQEGRQGVDWTLLHMTTAERVAFDLFLVRMNDELAWEAGTVEHRFHERVRRMAEACQEKTCWCHVDPHPADFFCSHCGCRGRE